jgi:D-glycerate 3-kinase
MNSDALNALDQAVAIARKRAGDRVAVVGVAGPQGSGKTTLVKAYAAFHPRTAHFSLDDVYLPSSLRRLIAQSVHPLFATRGPPGTHNVMQLNETIE